VLSAETDRLETLVRHARRKGVKATNRPEWSRAEMSGDPHRVARAARIYAFALLCYPRRLRARYGEEMRATFTARCRDAAQNGAFAIAILLARELADLAAASLAARRRSQTPVPGPSPVATSEGATS